MHTLMSWKADVCMFYTHVHMSVNVCILYKLVSVSMCGSIYVCTCISVNIGACLYVHACVHKSVTINKCLCVHVFHEYECECVDV